MAKATITFTLPDEQEEYDCCMAAPRLERAFRDLAETFRRNRKHDGPAVTEEMFWECLRENDVKIGE